MGQRDDSRAFTINNAWNPLVSQSSSPARTIFSTIIHQYGDYLHLVSKSSNISKCQHREIDTGRYCAMSQNSWNAKRPSQASQAGQAGPPSQSVRFGFWGPAFGANGPFISPASSRHRRGGLYPSGLRSWPSVTTSSIRASPHFVGPNIGDGPFPGDDCVGTCTCLCGCKVEVDGWRRACRGCAGGEHYDPDNPDIVFTGPPWRNS